MEKLLFVINPSAGTRRINRYLPDIIGLFNAGGYEVTVYMTTKVGDGADIVMARAKDFDLIVCAGGDGTFNEAVTGMLRCGESKPIGYIPCGSTNDFAASLGLSTNIMEAARRIVNGTPTPYDVGLFGNRYFSYVASFGAFTKASYSTPQNVKNALGHLAYILEGIQEIPQIRKTHVRFQMDGQTIEGDYLFGAISNSTSVGGVLTLNPKLVDMQDGKFELLLVRNPRDMQELADCITAIRDQDYCSGAITFQSFSDLTIYPDPAMPWTLDGEKAQGQDCIHVENLRHAISILL